MFRLKATLVATTLMRPWRSGWSVERGVDFCLTVATEPATSPPAARSDTAAAEPACFIDDDWIVPVNATRARPLENGASPGPLPEVTPDAPALRAWWSMASKSSQT